MRFYQVFLSLILAFTIFSCAANKRPNTPREKMKEYTQAIKKKDPAAMQALLSADSLKMAQNEAKEQKLPLDEVIQKESLFSEDQRVVEFRNEKTAGDRATLEMKDSAGLWNSVQFIKEDGIWKIDKKGYADDLQKQIDEDNKRLDEQVNRSRQ